MKSRLIATAIALPLSLLLGGCAVYGPPAPVAYETYPAPGPVVYSAPPVYAAPPVYVGPPAYFSFGFSSRWGHRGHWHR